LNRENAVTDEDLYRRGARTIVAAWGEYVRGTPGASLQRSPGVSIAIFPNGPERAVYNNALVDRDLDAAARVAAVDAMETAYMSAGVQRFAAWVHESDVPMRATLERRGYTVDETTRAMGMVLDGSPRPPREIERAPDNWTEAMRIIGAPPELLAGVDRAVFHIVIARLDGESVATAMSFDGDGDCGIYNVGTLEHARRRGLGTAVVLSHLSDAVGRGCETASLQATAIAERVYAAAGFRDLGRILEYVP